MPNWCYTEYRITGDSMEVKDLYDRMRRLEDMPQPLKPNGFGTNWLGNLVEDLGVDFNEVKCRGTWADLTLNGDVLWFTTETAWYRCQEVEDLLMKRYESLQISFRCEELGMAILETNDRSAFPEEYYIDAAMYDSGFYNKAGALDLLSNINNLDFNDIGEALDYVKEKNDDDENCVQVYHVDFI